MQRTSLTDLRDRVSDRLTVALEEHTAEFAQLGEPLTQFRAPAQALLGGGKRLRAQLCAAGWLAGGATETTADALVHAACSLELFQGAALVHDDVMDGSHTRRGMPAAHRHFAAEHVQQAWLGDPASYGEAGGIVLGDLLLALSSMELERARALVPAVAGARARQIYDVMAAEVALGQYLDIRSQDMPWQDDGAVALDRALQVVRHKSARYSVEHPVVLGAALAGAGDPHLRLLRGVGLPLGEAFQLRDDELGVFGDPAVTGKPVGEDLREGKRTPLLAMTMIRADGVARNFLRDRVGAADLTADEVGRMQEIMRRSGAVPAHEALIAERYEQGLSALHAADLPEGAVEALTALADALTRRTA